MGETGHAVPPSHLTILQADSHLFRSLAELVAYVVASTCSIWDWSLSL